MEHRTHTANDFSRRHRRVAVVCACVAVGMVGLSYAAVPLYQMFCRVTGYGGTPQVATAPSATTIDRTITMRFDANVSKKLAWKFEPLERKVELQLGENRLAYYRATNISDRPLTGTAAFNVSPDAAGIHFNKIECFCFTEQTLQPGETVEMPIVFFVDPDLDKNHELKTIKEITLSYTFYASDSEGS